MTTIVDGTLGVNRVMGGATVSGSLNFPIASSRIQGDFSNSSLSQRLLFQSNVANGITGIGVIPNGTATQANISVHNSADPANAAYGYFGIQSPEGLIVASDRLGSGVSQPFTLKVNGVAALKVATNGDTELPGFLKLGGNVELGSAAEGSGDRTSYVDFHARDGSDYDMRLIRLAGVNGASHLRHSGTGELLLICEHAAMISFWTNNIGRMFINSAGIVGINTTNILSASQSGVFAVRGPNKAASFLTDYGAPGGNTAITIGRSNDGPVCEMYNADGQKGSINVTATNTVYNTTSDYRLKDDIQDVRGSGAIIDALKPRTWKWKENGKPGIGFVAHEVAELIPDAVTGEKDGIDIADGISPKYQGFACGSPEMMAIMVAELKDLRARVAALEGA